MAEIEIKEVGHKTVKGKRMMPHFEVCGGQIVISQQVRELTIRIPIQQITVDGKPIETDITLYGSED